MTASALRAVLRLVAAAGIPGIIVASIADSTGAAITFGAITATAAFGLIVVTAATSGVAPDSVGQAIENRIQRLVGAGADESEVRELVGDAVRLGQHRQNS